MKSASEELSILWDFSAVSRRTPSNIKLRQVKGRVMHEIDSN